MATNCGSTPPTSTCTGSRCCPGEAVGWPLTIPGRRPTVGARALDEWRGPALHDVRHVPALYLEAQRLDELRLATIEARMSAELAVGGHGMVVGSLQRLVDEHPYRKGCGAC